MNFTLQVTNDFGKTWDFPFTLTKPDTIRNLNFNASASSIYLTWGQSPGAAGYNVYRCDVGDNDTEAGSYIQLNHDPVTMHADLGRIDASVNVADINWDGKKEIFAATRNGWLVGLTDTGEELYDIDNNVTTYSGFANMGIRAKAIPALADLKRNGSYNVVMPSRNEGSGTLVQKLFCYSVEDGDGDQKPDLLWSQPINNEYTTGAVLSNLDNSPDGSMEIVILPVGLSQFPISIYSADGVLLRTLSPGLSSYYYAYGALAVADLDGGDDIEIVFASNTSNYIQAYKWTGEKVLGFPVLAEKETPLNLCIDDVDNDGNRRWTFIKHERKNPVRRNADCKEQRLHTHSQQRGI